MSMRSVKHTVSLKMDDQTDGGAVADRQGDKPLRILWVKVGGLWPLTSGGRLRSFHIIRELSQRHQLTVITSQLPGEDGAELQQQLPQCRQIITVAHTPAKRLSLRFMLALFKSWFSTLPVDLYKNRIPALSKQVEVELATGDYDLCIADFLVAMPNVPAQASTPVLHFSHNVEYMIWQRLATAASNPLQRLVLALEWRKMRRYEHRACSRAALTVAVSEQDRQRLAKGTKGAQLRAIPTGVDVDFFKPDPVARLQPLSLVFSGSMDWQPNEDAMLFFIDAVLPRLRRELPEVTLTVVGRNPSRRLQRVADAAQVELTGTVTDVRPYIARAEVYIVPLRIGGGTRLKIYEALAMGKAVISTAVGAEGLPLEDGVHFLCADTAEDFAREILALLADPSRRKKLSQAGRQLMEQRFSWEQVSRDFESHCREVLSLGVSQ